MSMFWSTCQEEIAVTYTSVSFSGFKCHFPLSSKDIKDPKWQFLSLQKSHEVDAGKNYGSQPPESVHTDLCTFRKDRHYDQPTGRNEKSQRGWRQLWPWPRKDSQRNSRPELLQNTHFLWSPIKARKDKFNPKLFAIRILMRFIFQNKFCVRPFAGAAWNVLQSRSKRRFHPKRAKSGRNFQFHGYDHSIRGDHCGQVELN